MPERKGPTTGPLAMEGVLSYAATAGFKGDDLIMAGAIAWAESKGDAEAINNANSNGTTDYGLFQINSVHADLLKTGNWRNPADNAKMAHKIFADAGNSWSPWSTYKNGAYRQWMDKAKKAAKNVNPDTGGILVDGAADGAVVTSNPLDALGDIFNAISTIAQAVFKAGVWLADPHNWGRVALVAAGGMAMVGGLVIVAAPAAGKVASVAPGPVGQAARQVNRTGRAMR